MFTLLIAGTLAANMSFLIFDAGYAIVVNRYGANFEHVAAKL
jgi:hypothetical protein